MKTFNVIRSSHWEDTGEETKNLPEEALLQITADSQLYEDMRSGSLGCDGLLVLTVPANLYRVRNKPLFLAESTWPSATQPGRWFLWTPAPLCMPSFQHSQQPLEGGIAIPFLRWEKESREWLWKSLEVPRLVRNWAICCLTIMQHAPTAPSRNLPLWVLRLIPSCFPHSLSSSIFYVFNTPQVSILSHPLFESSS